MEEWRPVPEFEGLYEVSDLGRIRSCDRISPTKNRWGQILRRFPGRTLSCKPNSGGYPQVTLCDGDGGRVQKLLHWLVAAAFLGPRPDGLAVLHRDGIKKNCAISNLSYGTGKQNSADAIRHGTQVRGERQGQAKLTECAVREIRSAGMTNEQFAQKFGVSENTVAIARRGDSWKHVT